MRILFLSALLIGLSPTSFAETISNTTQQKCNQYHEEKKQEAVDGQHGYCVFDKKTKTCTCSDYEVISNDGSG